MTNKKKIRAGIAGSGFAATFHVDALLKVYGVEVDIVGCYSPTKEKRDTFSAKHGIMSFDSLDKLLDEVDVVHVCSTAVTHEQIAIRALEKNRFAIVEKPLTGYFGDGSVDFTATGCSRQKMFDGANGSVKRMLEAEQKSRGRILYAENWVYAPAIQKEREIIEKTGAQILWMHGEESHSGSHSPAYGFWRHAGGGAMMSKGCHPLTAALYLKRAEGLARDAKPIRPCAVSARVHSITALKNFRDEGHIRRNYHDIDDLAQMHVRFDDGTVADIFASDIVLGGVHNWIEVVANNHRTVCNINPNDSMKAYNPVDGNFKDIYVVEKTGTKQGWSNPSPDENWFTGYQQEMEAFYRTIAGDEPLQSDSALAADCIQTIYGAYLSDERSGAETKMPLI